MDDTCTQGVLSDETVHSQIEILNEDFLALPGTNGGNGTDTQIRFALATVDPDGNPTTGITRDCNTTWFNDNLDSEYWNELAWDPHNYLNLYTNTAGGSRGYVPFLPAAGPVGEPHDRVVVNWQAFGPGGPFPPHADGRTATHEIGHYLGLLHPYIPIGQCGAADPPGCYQSGDLICDTVVAEGPGDGCPIGAESCGSLDPIISYMDLTDDLCMEEFTLEQSRRLRCTLLHYRPDLYDVVETGPALMFDPAGLDFGEVAVGATSAPQIATLHNDGS
ncbi:MAG: M43 family zinc metalloprotease, partial [Thermoanaerobaculia bacterium]